MAIGIKKGLLVAAAVAAGLSLAGCASEGSACGNTTATPVAAPCPVNSCKNASHCKHVMHSDGSSAATGNG